MSQQTYIKVMKEKPHVTDEEIRSHMDFDRLLQLRKTVDGGLSKTTPKWLTITAYVVPVVILLSTVAYFTVPKNERELTSDPRSSEAPIINQDSTQHYTESTQEAVTNQATEKITAPTPSKMEEEKQAEQTKDQKSTLPTFTEAEPVDGYPALYEYFNRELTYPKEMAKDSIEGTVTVSFVISESGKPADIKVVKSLGEAFDKESIRIMEGMPAWKPATLNGTATTTRMSIPLTFRIIKK